MTFLARGGRGGGAWDGIWGGHNVRKGDNGMEWTGGTREREREREGKGGKAGRAPGKELFASNVHALFLLVEIGFCSALFNVWLQLGRVSVGGMSEVE